MRGLGSGPGARAHGSGWPRSGLDFAQYQWHGAEERTSNPRATMIRPPTLQLARFACHGPLLVAASATPRDESSTRAVCVGRSNATQHLSGVLRVESTIIAHRGRLALVMAYLLTVCAITIFDGSHTPQASERQRSARAAAARRAHKRRLRRRDASLCALVVSFC